MTRCRARVRSGALLSQAVAVYNVQWVPVGYAARLGELL